MEENLSNKMDLDKINIHAEPPAKEPARQYYYMAKCREWVQAFEQKNGRRPCFCIQTFGCQMNARDSEKLAGILARIGFVSQDHEEADLVLYNTCTVRDNANQRVYGRLGYVHSLKKKNPSMLIGLCGCMMQEETVIQKLKESYRFVDLVFGTHNIYKLAELLYARFSGETAVFDIEKENTRIVEALPVTRKYPYKSGVNIMYGCNNFCSYCIVPYVRGRERSRRPEEILDEIRALADDGVVEIMLLGQNVNSYGKTLSEPISFAALLRQVEQIDKIKRIRFMTSHPKDLSDELIETMGRSQKICRHLHLPLQSGSSRILKCMNRRYDQEQYLALAEKIRRNIPDISLTTDIIVGFPGETEEDFKETLKVVQKVRYESAFTFLYSKRTGTPAAAMEGQVPKEVAQDRFDRLLALIQQISRESCGRDTGRVMEALVEETNNQQEGFVTGRLSNNIMVHFPGPSDLVGRIVPVRLLESRGFYYMGRMEEQ